jgi:hypothetical protein
MSDEEMRDHIDRIVKEQRDKQDRSEQEQREIRDRFIALNRDLIDAYEDYSRAERDENFLGMAKAKARVDATKKKIEEMNNP